MKKSTILMLFLFVIASTGFSQMMEIENTITEKEEQMYEAIKSGDMETFKANLADNFVSVYGAGISDRAQELESIKELKIDSYELSDIRVMQPADNVAVIVYTVMSSGMWKNEKFSGKYYSTSTWVESGGDWKAIMHTETEAAPMEETVGMQDQD